MWLIMMLEKQLNISRDLSIFGKPKSIKNNNKDIFTWPITGKEDEDAVCEFCRDKPLSKMNPKFSSSKMNLLIGAELNML